MLQRLLWDLRNLYAVCLGAAFCLFVSYVLVETNPLPEYSAVLTVISLYAVGIVYALCCIAIGTMVFGQEFDSGTITQLLTQPLRRIRIWREKMFLSLGLMIGLCALLNLFVPPMLFAANPWLVDSPEGLDHKVKFLVFASSLFFLIAAWTSGPLFALYLRQTHLAMWLAATSWVFLFLAWESLLFLLWKTIDWVFVFPSRTGDPVGTALVSYAFLRFTSYVCLWAIWCGVSFIVARKLFLRLELIPGHQGRIGGTLSLPAFPNLEIVPRILASMGALGRNTHLVLKEIRLHASNLVFLGTILLLWLVLWGPSFKADYHIGEGYQLWELIGPLHCFVVFPCMAWVLPALVGATAMARERQIEIPDWQFSLPETRFKQWCIKVGVAAFIAVVCGALLGFALSLELERRLNHYSGFRTHFQGGDVRDYLVGTQLLFGFAVYVSSLMKDPLKALVGGVVFIGVTFLVLTSGVSLTNWFGYRPWMVVLPRQTFVVWLVPLSTLLLVLLTYWNFRPHGFALRRFAVQMAVWFAWVSLPVLVWVV